MDDYERVPVDEDGNEISPGGYPKWMEIKDPLALEFMSDRRRKRWGSREEKLLWKDVKLKLQAGLISEAWVRRCHEMGMKPVQATGMVGIMIPRWSWKGFCKQAADQEKASDWLSATNIRRRTALKDQQAGLAESPDQFRDLSSDAAL